MITNAEPYKFGTFHVVCIVIKNFPDKICVVYQPFIDIVDTRILAETVKIFTNWTYFVHMLTNFAKLSSSWPVQCKSN